MTTRRVVFIIAESESDATESDISESDEEKFIKDTPVNAPVNVVVEGVREVLPSDTQKDTQKDTQIPAQDVTKDTQKEQEDTQKEQEQKEQKEEELHISQELIDRDERARQSVNKAMKSYYYRNKEKILAKRKESRRLKALEREKAKILATKS